MDFDVFWKFLKRRLISPPPSFFGKLCCRWADELLLMLDADVQCSCFKHNMLILVYLDLVYFHFSDRLITVWSTNNSMISLTYNSPPKKPEIQYRVQDLHNHKSGRKRIQQCLGRNRCSQSHRTSMRCSFRSFQSPGVVFWWHQVGRRWRRRLGRWERWGRRWLFSLWRRWCLDATDLPALLRRNIYPPQNPSLSPLISCQNLCHSTHLLTHEICTHGFGWMGWEVPREDDMDYKRYMAKLTRQKLTPKTTSEM